MQEAHYNRVRMFAYAGHFDGSKDFFGAHKSRVEWTAIHADYEIKNQHSDIAILRVTRDFPLGRDIYPICLPSGVIDKASREGKRSSSTTRTQVSSFLTTRVLSTEDL